MIHMDDTYLPYKLPRLHHDFIHILGFELIVYTHPQALLFEEVSRVTKQDKREMREGESNREMKDGKKDRIRAIEREKTGESDIFTACFLHDFRLAEISATDLASSLPTMLP